MDTTKKVIRWMIEMKSLREEIKKAFYLDPKLKLHVKIDTPDNLIADRIIELIEKRIDELKNKYYPNMDLPLPTYVAHHTRYEILMELKQEILK